MTLTKLRRNESGIIIVIVIWILAVSSLMAVGLSKSLSIDLSLVKNEMALTRAKMAARSAVNYVFHHFVTKDDKDSLFNMKYPCGYVPSSDEKESAVVDVPVGKTGAFDLMVRNDDGNDIRYGIADEAARINLNTLNHQSYLIFAHLLMEVADLDEDDAYHIALSTVDWVDQDNAVSTTINGSGAEQNSYDEDRDAVTVKNAPMNHVGELLLIHGMTQEIFDQIQIHVTVFPREAQQFLMFNLNMVDVALMKSIALSFPSTRKEIVSSAVKKIDNFRRGNDEIYCTDDDQITFDSQENFELVKELYRTLSPSEEAVYRNLQTVHQVGNSAYVRFIARGHDRATSIYQDVNVVLNVEKSHVVLME